tara:strand:+ start:2189 stop:2578 length:390 start_codon:yes stop_codon:yes gene_type:complete
MQVYLNTDVNIDTSEFTLLHNDIETYVFTNDKIYKKYKKHFFEYNLNSNNETLNIKNKIILLEKGTPEINKKKIITTIPFSCYFVNRQIFKYKFNDDIIMVKEIDNDVFTNIYFELNNIEHINNLVCLM